MRESRKKLAADAWGSLLRVHADLVPLFDQLLRQQAGIPLAWYDVLLELSAAPEHRLTMGELGERVVLSRTRVSRLVDELVAEGFVRREPHAEDGRSTYGTLTPHGLAVFRRAAVVYVKGIETHFAAGLTDAELRALVKALETARSRHSPAD